MFPQLCCYARGVRTLLHLCSQPFVNQHFASFHYVPRHLQQHIYIEKIYMYELYEISIENVLLILFEMYIYTYVYEHLIRSRLSCLIPCFSCPEALIYLYVFSCIQFKSLNILCLFRTCLLNVNCIWVAYVLLPRVPNASHRIL